MTNNSSDTNRESAEYQAVIKDIFDKYHPVRIVTQPGREFGETLRSFEDTLQPDETVAVFNYGSNAPDELNRIFRENAVRGEAGFAGEAELRGVALKFGSKSIKRECPVATLAQGEETSSVIGYISLVTKEQFQLIARKECGPTMGRDKNKGRYRRAVIYFPDPTNPSCEMQAVTFVLNDRHADLQLQPVDSISNIRMKLGQSSERQKFEEYVKLIQKQKQQANERQNTDLENGPMINANWHSTSYLAR